MVYDERTDKKVRDQYARLPSSMEIITRHHGPIVKSTGQVIEINDGGRCFICAKLVENGVVCDKCGFTYCREHSGDEFHKCGLPKHQDDTKKELRQLALDVRRLMGAEYLYERKIKGD